MAPDGPYFTRMAGGGAAREKTTPPKPGGGGAKTKQKERSKRTPHQGIVYANQTQW